jgi:uncharacterized protein
MIDLDTLDTLITKAYHRLIEARNTGNLRAEQNHTHTVNALLDERLNRMEDT